jgi:tetratricopeptide (TPR) repeat protein
MALEYSASPSQSYREYIEQFHCKELIEARFPQEVRLLVGSMEAIFKNCVRGDAIKDFRVLFAHGGDIEVVSLYLWSVSMTLAAAHANAVNAFQALFVKPEDVGAALGHLSREVAPGSADSAYEAARTLMHAERFAEALAALGTSDDDHRVDYLRGVLLAGIPGQPRSAALIDLRAAEDAFVSATHKASFRHAAETAQCFIGAAKAAAADGRPADAERYFQTALGHAPYCAEALFELARLDLQAKNQAAARISLAKAVGLHWSYALRAAIDPLFQPRRAMMCGVLKSVVRRIAHEIAPEFKSVRSDVHFMRRWQDAHWRFDGTERWKGLIIRLGVIGCAIPARVLKDAYELRKGVRGVRADLDALARSYCTMLAERAEGIARRDWHETVRRAPARVAAQLARLFEVATGLTAIGLIAAGFYVLFVATGWSDQERLIGALGGLFGLVLAGQAPAKLLARACERWLASPVANAQAFLTLREQRRNRARAERNHARLRERLQRIGQRFGFAPPVIADVSELAPVSSPRGADYTVHAAAEAAPR